MLKQISFKKYNSNTSKGFTLLEVMIVISIISILAGFLIPKFIGYENKAKTVKAINTGKQIYNAVMCAYGDNGSDLTVLDVANSVTDLVGINVGGTGEVVKGDNMITVNYPSDSNNYSVVVTLSEGSYLVNMVNTAEQPVQIFSQTGTQD